MALFQRCFAEEKRQLGKEMVLLAEWHVIPAVDKPALVISFLFPSHGCLAPITLVKKATRGRESCQTFGSHGWLYLSLHSGS